MNTYVPGDIVTCCPTAWGHAHGQTEAYMLKERSQRYGPTKATARFSVRSLIFVLAVVPRPASIFGSQHMLLCVSSGGVIGWMHDCWVVRQ